MPNRACKDALINKITLWVTYILAGTYGVLQDTFVFLNENTGFITSVTAIISFVVNMYYTTIKKAH